MRQVRQDDEGHPRTCGGTLSSTRSRIGGRGSSPHLRGNRGRGGGRHGRIRVIPAPAGEPQVIVLVGPQAAGHPRTCGGTWPSYSVNGGLCGSSPHLRGNRIYVLITKTVIRVIPAPAGEPTNRRAGKHLVRGHPRTCGGTKWTAPSGEFDGGSSPHLRGNQVDRAFRRVRRRVIPAPAGEPIRISMWFLTLRGHPRTCGGTLSSRPLGGLVLGSSPHLRGNPRRLGRRAPVFRVIPAPAGEPSRSISSRMVSTGHPRTCGGTQIRHALRGFAIGSSPHLRGNPAC